MGTATLNNDPNLAAGGSKWGAVLSRGGKVKTGYIAFASSYVGGGMTCTISFGSKNPDFVGIEQQIPSSYQVQYDRTNTKVKVYDMASGTAPMVELASDTSVASLTSVHFFAVGV